MFGTVLNAPLGKTSWGVLEIQISNREIFRSGVRF